MTAGCHREGRSDLAFLSGQANKRDCHAALEMTAGCHREGRSDLAFLSGQAKKERLPRCARNDSRVIARDEAISPFPSCDQTKMRDCRAALASLSSRGTKRSRLSRPAINQKERLPRYARNDRRVIARDEAISPFPSCDQTKKRDCHASSLFCHREGRSDLAFRSLQ